jgi:hypothetical protein
MEIKPDEENFKKAKFTITEGQSWLDKWDILIFPIFIHTKWCEATDRTGYLA